MWERGTQNVSIYWERYLKTNAKREEWNVWILKSFTMSFRVEWSIVTWVSEESSSLFFRIYPSTLCGLLDSESGAVRSFQMSITVYQSTRSNTPEEFNLPCCYENLKYCSWLFLSVCFCLDLIQNRTGCTVKKFIICIADVNYWEIAWCFFLTVHYELTIY